MSSIKTTPSVTPSLGGPKAPSIGMGPSALDLNPAKHPGLLDPVKDELQKVMDAIGKTVGDVAKAVTQTAAAAKELGSLVPNATDLAATRESRESLSKVLRDGDPE